jgi:hypothetical protein
VPDVSPSERAQIARSYFDALRGGGRGADALRLDEFAGDGLAREAFRRHEKAGDITICGRGGPRRPPRADTPSTVLGATVLRAEWDRNVPDGRGVRPQAEFDGDFEAYSAFRRADARGLVQIVRDSPGVHT